MVLIALLVGVAGCGKKAAGPPPMMAPEVAVVTMQPERVIITTELPGRTAPFRIAEIRPQVSGVILHRRFEEGAVVEAGQVLYEIDPAMYAATLESANASLNRAEAGAKAIALRAGRVKELIADKAISQQDYDDAQAAAKAAEAEILYWKSAVNQAQINLDYTRIKAPIGGRIGKSSVTDGAMVMAYQPVPLATRGPPRCQVPTRRHRPARFFRGSKQRPT
jgi:membrane fusion protein (multidrug efflux system)